MDWTEALEIVVAATGHEAYRRHCADDNPQRDVWRRRMIAKAAGVPPPEQRPRAPRMPVIDLRTTPIDPRPAADPGRPAVADSMKLLQAAKRCPFSSRDQDCGCSGIRCAIRPPAQQIVSPQDCIECIRRYGP